MRQPNPRAVFNPKRKIRVGITQEETESLIRQVSYSGSPEHKMNPGDFNLTPPASPRKDATLCDGCGILTRRDAQKALKDGIRHGTISVCSRNGFPQNVWSVTSSGIPLEAQLENQGTGTYHGYPMDNDEFSKVVIKQWRKHEARD